MDSKSNSEIESVKRDLDEEKTLAEMQRLRLEKTKVLVSVLAGIVVPIAIMITGFIYKTVEDNKVDESKISVAANILNSSNKNTPTALRIWAADVINNISTTKMDDWNLDKWVWARKHLKFVLEDIDHREIYDKGLEEGLNSMKSAIKAQKHNGHAISEIKNYGEARTNQFLLCWEDTKCRNDIKY